MKRLLLACVFSLLPGPDLPPPGTSRYPDLPQVRVSISREGLFSLDPEVSLPWLRLAIEQHEGDLVELAWLKGNPETRKAALEYLLRPETESPEDLELLLEGISGELELRKSEVRAFRRR
jgi:hypothetical protein